MTHSARKVIKSRTILSFFPLKSANIKNKIVDGWERTETDNGVPYYINHQAERTSWDHPYWAKLCEDLRDHDDVRYAAYRTAMKLRQLQMALQLHHVDLHTLRVEFDHRGYTDGCWDSVCCDEIWSILVAVYTVSHLAYRRAGEPEILADLALNLLQNLFDTDRRGKMGVMPVKLALATMTAARLVEKYRFFYQELHDPSTFISRRILTAFLEAIIKIPELLEESAAFGRNMGPAVSSCCQLGEEVGGVSEDVFYRWLQKEPQTLVWLPTVHRVISTETIRHEVKCNVCKAFPIIGFRYRCLQCFNFDLCQTCFFTGKTRKKHKLKHPIQEYCITSTTKDDTADFVKTLRNNLSRKHRRKSVITYLPIDTDSQPADQVGPHDLLKPDVHAEISEAARKLADLERDLDPEAGLPSPITHHTPPRHFTLDTEPTPSDIYTTPTQARPDVQLTPRDIFSDLENLSPKRDGLQRERDELNAVIRQLQDENRALHAQLASMEDIGSSDSITSVDRQAVSGDEEDLKPATPTHGHPDAIHEPRYLASQPLKSRVRSRLYLGVPVITPRAAGPARHTSSCNTQPVPQPPLSSQDAYSIACTPSVGLSPPEYTPHRQAMASQSYRLAVSAPFPTGSPPANTTLGDELDQLSLSSAQSPPWTNSSVLSIQENISSAFSQKLTNSSALSQKWTNSSALSPKWTHSSAFSPQRNNSVTKSSQSKAWANAHPKYSLSPPGTSTSSNHPTSPPALTNRTYGDSLDNLDVSPSVFSLPSPTSSQDYNVEEEELQALVDNMDTVFPSELSYTAVPASRLSSDENEMLTAALTVGTAMSEFVTRAIHRPGDY